MKDNLLEKQYETLVSLYQHEDNLNWSKLNNFFYITSALGALVFLIISNFEQEVLRLLGAVLVAIVGLISSITFRAAILSGREYLSTRKQVLRSVDETIGKETGVRIFIEKDGHSGTTKVIPRIPLFVAVVWGIVMGIAVYLLVF